MAKLFDWFFIFLACTAAQHYNNTARLNLAMLATPSTWVTPISSVKTFNSQGSTCALHRDLLLPPFGCIDLMSQLPATMATLYDQALGRSMAQNNTGVFSGRNLPILSNIVTRWLQIDQEGGGQRERPWMVKHRTGQLSTGPNWKSFYVFSTLCPGQNLLQCGNWFSTAHTLAAFFQGREQERNDNTAKLPTIVIGPMEYQDRFATVFQALGSVGLAPFWPLRDDPNGLLVVFGFASTLYGSLAAAFVLDQQGHTRAQGIQQPGTWMKSSMVQFASQSELIRIGECEYFEPIFDESGRSTGTWMYLVYERAYDNMETSGLYAWFIATVLHYNSDSYLEANRAKRSVRSYPAVWNLLTDVIFYAFFMAKPMVWASRHIFGGFMSAVGIWVLQMDVADTEQHNTYCSWLRSHSSAERNIIRPDSYFKIMDWAFACTQKAFCWDYVKPGLCIERTGAYESLANAWVIGNQFPNIANFERGQQGGAFEGESVIGFEYCYSTLMDDNGAINAVDIPTCIKNNIPVSGWVSDMTFFKNNEEKMVPSSKMNLLQVTDDQCDIWMVGWLQDINIQHVLQLNSHDPNSATNMTPAIPYGCGTQKPPNDHRECAGGEYYVMLTAECLACPSGRYSNKGKYNACQDCDAGKYSGMNASLCPFCDAGKSSQPRSSTCTTCVPGTYSDKGGSATCNDCVPGRFAQNSGARGCDACPLGKYQSNASSNACVDCEANMYTQNFASVSPEDCWCSENFYQNNDTKLCVFCYDKYPQGAIRCDGAQNAAIYIQPGYMTWQSDQKFFFCETCQTPECCPNDCDDASRCNIAPGASELVQCGSTASGAGCGKCVPHYSWNVAESKCIECNDAAFSAGATITFGIVLVILVFRVCPRDVEFGMRSLVQMATVANACGPFLSWVEFSQIMIVVMDLDLPWPIDILDSIGSITDFLSMDLFEFECEFTNKTAFVGSYILAVNILPVLFVAFMVLISLPSALSKTLRKLHFPSPVLTGNVTWTVIHVFTITIINFAASVPLRSVEQPVANGEPMSTMWRFPFVLLDSNTGRACRVAGVAIFCSWLFLILVASPLFLYYTHIYGSMLVRQCTVSMVIKYRNGFSFLFVVDAVYKISINMSGILFPANPAWQIQSVAVPTMISLFLLIRFFPHRFFLHGIVDCVRTFALVPMIFVCFAVIVQGQAWPFIAFGVIVTIFCWAAEFFCLFQSFSSMMRGATSFEHFMTTQSKLINSVRCNFLQSRQKKYNVYPNSVLLRQISYFEPRGSLEFRAVNHPQTTLNIKLKQSAVLWQLVASEMKNGANLNELERKFQQQMTEQFSMNLWAQYREKHCSLMR